MIIDLHIHSKTCSDGNLSVEEVVQEAKTRNIKLMSITDHDTIECQKQAKILTEKHRIDYVNGVELNIIFSHPNFSQGKPISLDLLGYKFDSSNEGLRRKLQEIVQYREQRIKKILKNLNIEFKKEGISPLTEDDLTRIKNSVDGVLGRPHLADYLVKKKIVRSRQEAFNKFLVRCNVPKYPLSLEKASNLLKDAGGIAVLAHPNDPYGTSLIKLTKDLKEQTSIIEDLMLTHIDGIECWHSRNTAETTRHYCSFSKNHGLIMTGGSDCHQNPIIMGTVRIPSFVALQFAE